MKLNEYVRKKDFDFGLPQGDTLVDLDRTEIEESSFRTREGEEKPVWVLTLPTGEQYSVPKTVVAGLKKCVEDGFGVARVTRTGTQLETRYTVVGAKA